MQSPEKVSTQNTAHSFCACINGSMEPAVTWPLLIAELIKIEAWCRYKSRFYVTYSSFQGMSLSLMVIEEIIEKYHNYCKGIR